LKLNARLRDRVECIDLSGESLNFISLKRRIVYGKKESSTANIGWERFNRCGKDDREGSRQGGVGSVCGNSWEHCASEKGSISALREIDGHSAAKGHAVGACEESGRPKAS